jgi:RNA polymerase sigma-70 factor (ECF subfamily)
VTNSEDGDVPEVPAEGAPEPEPAEEVQSSDPELQRSREEDHQLLRRAQAGEERAFEALVRKHQTRAWRAARNLVGNDEDAADLAQEAFVRVFRNLSGFDFEHSFTTWLYRIVTNLAIDHLRRRRPVWSTASQGEDEGEQELVDARVASPAEGLESGELALEVKACMEALAPHFQSVLMLREIEGLPCNQIAQIVGATHVTVRWRLHRGRKLFQEEWERRARLREQTGRASVERTNSERGPDVRTGEEEGLR